MGSMMAIGLGGALAFPAKARPLRWELRPPPAAHPKRGAGRPEAALSMIAVA